MPDNNFNVSSFLNAETLKSIGIAGLLAFILWASFSGMWVWGDQLKAEQARTAAAVAERDKWQNLAIAGTKLAEVSAAKTGRFPMPITSSAHVADTTSGPATPEEIAARLDNVSEVVQPGMERVPLVETLKNPGAVLRP